MTEDELDLKHRKEENQALLDDNKMLKKSLENAEKEAKEAKAKLEQKEQEIMKLSKEAVRRTDELETAYTRISLLKNLPSKEAQLANEANKVKVQQTPEDQAESERAKYAAAAKAFS